MKKQILDRYARTSDNRLLIEIHATRVEDLYNDFDKNAPYRRKELDPDLVDYIIDSVREIGREDFVIRFSLAVQTDQNIESRIEKSVRNYFLYLKELEMRELTRMVRSSMSLFVLGIVILSLSVWLNRRVNGTETIISHIVNEGLTVAAWVALWNPIAALFLSWAPHQRQIKLYEKITDAPISFSGKDISGE